MGFGSSCDFLITSCIWCLSVYYKTDFSTSISWYINIISVNEITVFNCRFKLKPKMLLLYFYSRIPGTTAAGFYRKFYGIFITV